MLDIKQIIKEELQKARNELFLSEGQAEKLISNFPELKPAYDAGIKNPHYLQWIQNKRSDEPIAHVIGVVKSFDKKKDLLKSKGKPTDIFEYESIASLQKALNDVGTSKSQAKRELKSEEATHLGNFGNWIVVMPHTKESSCELGKGTTWCTAATQSKNLFYSYVGREDEDTILYYIIKKGADSRVDPNAKLSVGFVDGEPVLEGEDGHVSVNANNEGLTERRLEAILGDQFEPIMAVMEKHSSSLNGKHPAKAKIEKMAKDPSELEKGLKGLKGLERVNFIKQILEYDASPEVLYILSEENDPLIKQVVARNTSTPPKALNKLSLDENVELRMLVAKNTSTPPEALIRLSEDKNVYVRSQVALNTSAPPEVLNKLYQDDNMAIRQHIASNTSTPPKALNILSDDKEESVRYEVALNTSTPPETLIRLSEDENKLIKIYVASNPSTPTETLERLSQDGNFHVKRNVASNTSTPTKILTQFSQSESTGLRWAVAKNPSAPIEDLIRLSQDKIIEIRKDVKKNPTYINYIQNQKAINEEKKTMLLKQIIKEELQKVLNERKEMVDYHVKNKIPFSQNIYREGSENYFIVISEARKRYKQGTLKTTNKEDIELFENSDLGEWAMFEGERVPLDFPMWEVTLEEAKAKKKDPPLNKPMKNSGGGKKWKVYVRSKSGGIKKITYGDAKGGLKGNWNDPEARASFAARHKCAQKKDKTTPGYWACRAHKDFGTNVPGRFW